MAASGPPPLPPSSDVEAQSFSVGLSLRGQVGEAATVAAKVRIAAFFLADLLARVPPQPGWWPTGALQDICEGFFAVQNYDQVHRPFPVELREYL